MKFKINFGRQPLKFFKGKDKNIFERIVNKIDFVLIENPVPQNAKRVENRKELVFRIRIGDYRVLYEVDYDNKIIGIIKIDKKSRAYD